MVHFSKLLQFFGNKSLTICKYLGSCTVSFLKFYLGDPSILKRFPTTMVHPDVMRTLKTKWLKCLKCDFKTKHKGAYNIHQVMHNGTRPFTCPFCNYTATRREHLTQHKTLAHEALSNRQKTCSKCNAIYITDQGLSLKIRCQ